MDIKLIPHNSDEYLATTLLRERLLRSPLGLQFTPEELAQEKNEHHIAAYDNDSLIGCLVLVPIDERTMKMRQLVIETHHQGEGIGKKLVDFSENFTLEKGCSTIILHARKRAVAFYMKFDYEVVGDEFIEVTIPHYKMKKELQ